MPKYSHYLIVIILLLIPLYPKFPLFGLSDTFVSIRLEDVVLGLFYLLYAVYLFRHDLHIPRHRQPAHVRMGERYDVV